MWMEQFYFFFFFFGGSSSELLPVLVLLLLEELESESESEDEEELVEEAEDDELEELSSVSLSSEEDEVDVSSLSDEESLAELSLLLLLELLSLVLLFSKAYVGDKLVLNCLNVWTLPSFCLGSDTLHWTVPPLDVLHTLLTLQASSCSSWMPPNLPHFSADIPMPGRSPVWMPALLCTT
ncbi:hypothetical protein PAL_GLEAN10016880 [Pteropus alecto]|uniref:Uncharacterized protein n=1 Tax=Pteropus alecto TaxID=9402 RepID=L5JX67_PTEAL|nr:hypothetical protein PAL_GLEAN10016880 [Pteropus alecto]